MPAHAVENDRSRLVLDRSLLTYFANEPYLHVVLNKLMSSDIFLVRDLANMTLIDLRSLIKTTDRNERLIIHKLKQDGIYLK